MIVESSQLLACCFTLDRLAAPDCPRTQKGNPRKHFNPKHPSSLWTTASRANMFWLLDHVDEMIREKSCRYPDKPVHFCAEFVEWVRDHVDESIVTEGHLTQFALAISAESICRTLPFFDRLSIVEKYRTYYILDKSKIAFWKLENRRPPWYGSHYINELSLSNGNN